MRVIKFRGKRPDGSWNYGRSIRFKQNGEVYIQGASVDPQTVGQFTGLCDFNGRDIYDGDIIMSVSSEEGNMEVEILHLIGYNKEYAAYTATLINENMYKDLKEECHVPQSWVNECGKRVIGNIYDNPELLK